MASPGPKKQPTLSGKTQSATTPTDEPVFLHSIEHYEIGNPIGYGSSAIVFNATYKPLNKKVAIKIIDLDWFERNQIDELRRETQLMSLSKHPNVLRVYGSFVNESKLYIVTPFMSAGSCLDIMKTAHPEGFEEAVIATILKQALQGLDYLHRNGHIHRDVKAGNLLVDADGTVLLADFGVSSSLTESGDRRGFRKTFVGTPCWMAPEVMEQAGYDYKADIWSFGITAIELATGHAPFSKYPPLKVLMLTISNDPPTLDRDATKHKYSRTLKEMIDSCLQKDPAKRPTAERLLSNSFKQAKKKDFLIKHLIQDLPPLEERPHKRVQEKPIVIPKGVSWDFGELKEENCNEDNVIINIAGEHDRGQSASTNLTEDGAKLAVQDMRNQVHSAAQNVSPLVETKHVAFVTPLDNASTVASQVSDTSTSSASLSGRKSRFSLVIENTNSGSSSTSTGSNAAPASTQSSVGSGDSTTAQEPPLQRTQNEIKKGRFHVIENHSPREQSASVSTQPDFEVHSHQMLSREQSNESLKGSCDTQMEPIRKHRFEMQPLPVDFHNVVTSEENALQEGATPSKEPSASRNDSSQKTEPITQAAQPHVEPGVSGPEKPTVGTRKGRFELSFSQNYEGSAASQQGGSHNLPKQA